MDAFKFIKNFRRLCYSQDYCRKCPCYNKNNENCNLLSDDLTDEEILKYIETVEEWIKEHPVEIDWSKVPKDTPVCVRQNKTDEKLCRYFTKYYPNDEKPFQCYSDGRTSWTANEFTTRWIYCEPAREEDVEKYAKSEEV